MKKVFTLILALLFVTNLTKAQCDPPNASFETFIDITDVIEYDFDIELDEPVFIADGWAPVIRLLLFAFSDFFYTLTGAELFDFISNGYGQAIYEPGANGTDRALKLTPGQYIPFSDAFTVMDCGERPEALKGYFRHVGTDLDTFIIYSILNDTVANLDFLSQDPEDLAPFVDGFAFQVFTGGADEYVEFEIPISYNTENVPDSAALYMISVVDSAAIANGTEAYHVIDELNFGMLTSSTVDIVQEDLFEIFPNPGNGLFTIDSEARIEEIQLINAFGQVVYINQNVNEYRTSIDISNQNHGIYFVDVRSGDKVSRKKIIKIE